MGGDVLDRKESEEMPIVVPPPPNPPVDLSTEEAINRELTRQFISFAPVQIELIPYVSTRLPSGGKALAAQDPRPMQTFRLIPMSHTERPRTSTSAAAAADEGKQRRYEYTLLGEWNSEMAVNDRWVTPEGQTLVIAAIVSFNGYERKGLITSYGGSPSHA
jgi:hypothetical protein